MPTCSRQTLVKDHAFLVKTGVLPQVALWGKGIWCLRRFCYARNMYNKRIFVVLQTKSHEIKLVADLRNIRTSSRFS